jgi:hypothetical protein
VKSFFLYLTLTITISFSQFAFADNHLIKMNIDRLRPTQASVGMLEVARKVRKINKMNSLELEGFLLINPVPVVKGFDGEYFLIDRHHLSRAFLEAGYHYVYVYQVADLNDSENTEAFWREMEKTGFVYLKDEFGRTITPDQLPTKVSELKDDPYRSLAAYVRRFGGYTKDTTPFAEFKWANFFRTRLKFENSEEGLKRVLPEALKLARSQEAAGLPGYISR